MCFCARTLPVRVPLPAAGQRHARPSCTRRRGPSDDRTGAVAKAALATSGCTGMEQDWEPSRDAMLVVTGFTCTTERNKAR